MSTREERLARYLQPADWSSEPMVDDDKKLHLPIQVVKSVNGPLDMAFNMIGAAMNSSAGIEDCTADQVRARAAWHALHYVQRRLAGWDSLPDDFFMDSLNWEQQTERFKQLADARERETQ
jgi:hypothetical protein